MVSADARPPLWCVAGYNGVPYAVQRNGRPIRVLIGSDAHNVKAERALAYSIRRNSTSPVDITNTTGPTWVTPAYDPAGNMTTLPKPTTPSSDYTATYDAWNRLVTLQEDDGQGGLQTVQENAYDGRTFRIVRNDYAAGSLDETRHFFYTPGWQCIEERVDTDTDPNRQYVWGTRYIDDLILRDRDTTGNGTLDERLYACQDANWNVTSITDATGDVQERYDYDPYGQPTFLSPTFASRSASDFAWETLFAGYRSDDVTGLFIVRNRVYHPRLGTWVQRDPFGYADGFSLYPAWFVPSTTDPYGLRKAKVIGYIVRRVGDDLVRVADIRSQAAAAKAFARGSNIFITTGRSAAKQIAKKLQGRLGKSAGNLLEHGPHKPGYRPHFQFGDVPGRHIFYSGLLGLLSASELSGAEGEECTKETECDVEIDDIYEYTMTEDTIFQGWTFEFHFGSNSPLRHLDWVNPLELVSAAAQAGRDFDRWRTSKLAGTLITITCKDGSNASVSLDLKGNVLGVSLAADEASAPQTMAGAEYFDKLSRGEAPPIPGIKCPRK